MFKECNTDILLKRYAIGTKASLSKTFTEEDVKCFAQISGDTNPVHLDESVARQSIFGRRICHGVLVKGLISAVIGTDYPGNGTIYMEQDSRFLKPAYIGEKLQATVEVTEHINLEKHIIRLKTYVLNQNEEIVIDGYAVVKVP